MKIHQRLFLILAASALVAGSLFSRVLAQTPGKEIAIVEFTDKTRVLDSVLQGKYVVVHDETKMAKGEPCLYIYTYTEGVRLDQGESQLGKLVVSFHCKPVQRNKARDVIMTLAMSSDPSVFLLKEIQLTGSTEGHQVP